MRVPLSWLADDAGLPPGALGPHPDADAVGEAFVRVGLEIDELDVLAGVSGPVVVGRVAEITELTGYKKPIRFCLVDVGGDEPRGIVCGARNFAFGDLVVAALPGAELPGGFAIAARQTYGHVSDGMLCSGRELGLGSEHSGILVLPAATAEPGAGAREVVGLADAVFDLDVTPDRGYCFSMRGVARELSAVLEVPFVDRGVAPVPEATTPAWPVSLAPDSGCSRFTARLVTGVDVTARSPWWLQRRLLLSGLRPISAAVDVTNYVMLELGQPLHAFDATLLTGELRVRRAQAGETLRTLDDRVRTLDPGDVVIADDTGAISLAGVMGGASTEVGAATTDVLLEAAAWDPLSVFRTARRHKLPSEASRRYERVVDPALAPVALERAATLLVEIAGGAVAPGRTDLGSVPPPTGIELDVALPDRVAGRTYPPGTTVHRLEQVGCSVTGATELVVCPPTWRPDLRLPADLVEEVLRLEGLDLIPSVLPAAPPGRGLTPRQRRRRAVSRAVAAQGCVEILPTVFLSAGILDGFGLDAADPRRSTAAVLNPLEADRAELATTLLPALVEALTRNVSRGVRDVALYAVAQVVLPRTGPPRGPLPTVEHPPDAQRLRAIDAGLPAQPVHVAAVLAGRREPPGWWGGGRVAEVSDAIALAHAAAAAAGVELEVRADQLAPWHPGRCAALVHDGLVVGHAGELHPGVVARLELPPRTCAMELDLDALPLGRSRPAPSVSAFPPVFQDVALVIEDGVAAAELGRALRAGGGQLLEDVRLFDVYSGAQVGPGRRSLAYALRVRASDRTLTEAEASAVRDAAVAEAGRRVGAVLRGTRS